MVPQPENENHDKQQKGLSKLIEIVKGFKDLDLKTSEDFKDKFNKVWPVAKKTLEFAIEMKLTGKKFDKAANEVIVIGDNMYNNGATDEGRTELNKKFNAIWKKIRTALNGLKFISDAKKDAVIDKIIEIGDWVFGK